ncbi:MAG: thioredoxin [Sphingobacteriales bacterium]|nr:MAG: thioredoxin [Sphingobacteriales bacterium]
MRVVFSFLILLLSVSMQAQTFTTEKDSASGEVILKGSCRFQDLNANPVFTWMQAATAYKPKAEPMAVLQKELLKHRMVVLFGSWCSDSQLQLPHLYKILQDAKVPENQITLYGVDRAKKSRGPESETYKVERVPTIIVLDGDNELGRIVESPRKTLEEDLAVIVSGR